VLEESHLQDRVACSFCDNDELGPTDFDLLSDGKIYCWRCKYYFKDKHGKYQEKRLYGKKVA